MDYQAACDYILALTDYEKMPGLGRSASNFDLRRTEELLHLLSGPHLGPATVHVTGTKGKGSTSAMVASALTASGYATGLFTSPHLHSLCERVAIDGRPIAEHEVAGLVTRLRPLVEEVNREARYGRLTTFEVLTALAFVYFRERNVDFQVMEVGLGGRLDATNVVRPDVCIMTPISYDHMEILGNTLREIATEKAGIIKRGCTVVTAPQPAEALAVIEDACRRCGVELVRVGRDLRWEKGGSDLVGQSFAVQGRDRSYDLTIPLLGEHQLDNATTAVATLEVLARRHSGITAQSIQRGLAAVSWPGRLQVVRRQPVVVVDGAHNVESACKLRQALEQYFRYRRLILVIGTSADKDVPGIVAELAPAACCAIAARSRNPRATPPEALACLFEKAGLGARQSDSVAQALDMALSEAGPDDLVCVTGSIFVVAEALEHVKGAAGTTG